MALNKNIKIIINYLLGPVILLLFMVVIYRQMVQTHNWKQSWLQINNALNGPERWKIVLVFLLMGLNWGIEAKKWQLSISPVQHMKWWHAFKAILAGSTMASFTPNRTGEYFGRMLYVEEGKRAMSIPLTLLCSFAQIIITMVTGGLGIIYLLSQTHDYGELHMNVLIFWLKLLLVIVFSGMVFLAVLYFRLPWVVKMMTSFRRLDKYFIYVKILEQVQATVLLRILLLSFLRYGVFILQYYWMFEVCGVQLSLAQTFGSISVVFLVMAIVPTFTFLTELGLRWEASIQLVELFSSNAIGIFAGSFGIWLINLVIPALAGSLLMLRIKLFKYR